MCVFLFGVSVISVCFSDVCMCLTDRVCLDVSVLVFVFDVCVCLTCVCVCDLHACSCVCLTDRCVCAFPV